VRNYIALLGWGLGDQQLFTTEELQENFTLERVSRSPAVFDEHKLRWMNGHYLRELPVDELARRLEAFTGRDCLREAAALTQEKMQTLSEFWPMAGFFFDGPVDDPKAFEKVILKDDGVGILAEAREALAAADPWETEPIEAALRGVVDHRGAKPGQVFQPVRVAIAGTTISPGIFESLHLLGRDEALRRIDAALERAGVRA
jgi:glutamyl-tRNA synthetase